MTAATWWEATRELDALDDRPWRRPSCRTLCRPGLHTRSCDHWWTANAPTTVASPSPSPCAS